MKWILLMSTCLVFCTTFAQVNHDTLDLSKVSDKECSTAIKNFEDSLSKWFYSVYAPKMKVKLSCASCSRFSIELILQIDENGQPAAVQAVSSNYCGKILSEKQKKYFINGIKKLKFAPCMKGRLWRYTFQRALMC